MDSVNVTVILVAIVYLVAVADIWLSRLTLAARVLWTLNVIFLVGVGLIMWVLTRRSAYDNAPEIPEPGDATASSA